MDSIPTSLPELLLVKPDPDRDAVFAYQWFSSATGRETLLKMGNPPGDITASTLDGERATIEEFLRLEQEQKQKTWMIRHGDVTIGAVWIDLVENHGVAAPSLHFIICDPAFRGKGMGGAVMRTVIKYLEEKDYKTVYSRYLTNNRTIHHMFESLGFSLAEPSYTDKDGLEWQKVEKRLSTPSF